MIEEQITELNNILDGFLIKFGEMSKEDQIRFIGLNPFLYNIYQLGCYDGQEALKNVTKEIRL